MKEAIITLVVAVGFVVTGIGNLANQYDYLPTDVRSQPWFYPVTSGILLIAGLFILAVGIRRFRRARH
jgi:hypothetical protein